eukprot:UN13492
MVVNIHTICFLVSRIVFSSAFQTSVLLLEVVQFSFKLHGISLLP